MHLKHFENCLQRYLQDAASVIGIFAKYIHLLLQVKMVTDDDDKRTEIRIEGDPEEAERLRKELGLAEKGKVYVKGLLES